jgi:hypothetical protein
VQFCSTFDERHVHRYFISPAGGAPVLVILNLCGGELSQRTAFA